MHNNHCVQSVSKRQSQLIEYGVLLPLYVRVKPPGDAPRKDNTYVRAMVRYHRTVQFPLLSLSVVSCYKHGVKAPTSRGYSVP